jgi:hypothetical protein
VEPPVPIPNTAVKHFSADDTERATPCGKYVTARKLYPSPAPFLKVNVAGKRSHGGDYGEPI